MHHHARILQQREVVTSARRARGASKGLEVISVKARKPTATVPITDRMRQHRHRQVAAELRHREPPHAAGSRITALHRAPSCRPDPPMPVGQAAASSGGLLAT